MLYKQSYDQKDGKLAQLGIVMHMTALRPSTAALCISNAMQPHQYGLQCHIMHATCKQI